MIEWINKRITHNRDNDGDFGIRMLMHIPIGILMGVPVIGWGLIPLFVFYEQNEDAHCKDEAWKDTFGAIVGFVVSEIIGLWVWLNWLTN